MAADRARDRACQLAFNIAPYFVLLGSGRARRSALIVLAAGAAQFAVACRSPVWSFDAACSPVRLFATDGVSIQGALYDTRVG